jgi:DNA-binding response OmpR family regulator
MSLEIPFAQVEPPACASPAPYAGPAMGRRVLVVDELADWARTIVRLLRPRGHQVDAAYSATDARHLALANRYDLIVLDLALPGGDGLGLLVELREQACGAQILALSGHDDVGEKIDALAAGAEDVAVKGCAPGELAARIEVCLRRSSGVRPAVKPGPMTVDLANQLAWLDGNPLDLTQAELRIVARLVVAQGAVVPRTELGWCATRRTDDGVRDSFDMHLVRLRSKLGAEAWRIETVRGSGVRLRNHVNGGAKPKASSRRRRRGG